MGIKGISVQQASDIKKQKGLIVTKLEKIRVNRNLSQSELAARSGVSINNIRVYEQQRRLVDNAKISTLLNLCIALECKLDDILEDEDTISKLNIVSGFLKKETVEIIKQNRTFSNEEDLYKYFFDNTDLQQMTEDQRRGIEYELLNFPKKWSEILKLRYGEKMSLKKISENQRITVARVQQIIFKALSKLESLKTSEYVVYGFLTWHKKSISEEINRDIREIPIEEMHLSGRAYNCLMRSDITTIGKAKLLTKEDLLKIKNMGESAAEEILEKLEKYN